MTAKTTNEEKKMTWKEALEHAKQGKKIRKGAWRSDWYVILNGETFRWCWHDGTVWHVGSGDLTDKWEIYEEEEKPKSAWKCCKEEPFPGNRDVLIRAKDSLRTHRIAFFNGSQELVINGVVAKYPENYEYCELPE